MLRSAVVALGISYAIPIASHMLQCRRTLPLTRKFKLWEPLAWFANIVSVIFVVVTTILFLFPPQLPVTAGNMNYCVVAFGVVLTISMTQWITDGRKNFKGPQIAS